MDIIKLWNKQIIAYQTITIVVIWAYFVIMVVVWINFFVVIWAFFVVVGLSRLSLLGSGIQNLFESV